MDIGQRIKEIREEKKIQLSVLANKIKMSSGVLSEIESGKRSNPTIETLAKIASALNVPVSSLVEEEKSDYIPSENTSGPSMEEIINETAFRVSEETINRIREKYQEPLLKQFNELSNLVKKGRQVEVQEKEDFPPNALTMTTSDITFPLLKNIRAGELGTEVEMENEPISVPGSWKGKGNFCVRIKGNSMKSEGIHDGMIVLIRKQPTVESGNTALVYKYSTDEVNGILKKVKYLPDGKILLFNGNNENFEIGEDFEIIGKVVKWMVP